MAGNPRRRQPHLLRNIIRRQADFLLTHNLPWLLGIAVSEEMEQI